jgi:predicted transcriptional regulator
MSIETQSVVASATAQIVAAYVRRQQVPPGELTVLLAQVMSALSFGQEAQDQAPQQPAVSLRRLIKTDTVTCAECGWTGKSMRRHLTAEHGLTPEAYRAKWGLKTDHPMIAPSYAARRAELARSFGLGSRHVAPAPPARKAAR